MASTSTAVKGARAFQTNSYPDRDEKQLAAGPDTCLHEVIAREPDPDGIPGSGLFCAYRSIKPPGIFHKIQYLTNLVGRVAYAGAKARMEDDELAKLKSLGGKLDRGCCRRARPESRRDRR